MKCVVLSSGGMDSTTCLSLAVNHYGAENVISLSIIYGQKHIKEIEAARKVAEYYNVQHYEKDLTSVFDFSNCSLLSKSTDSIVHQSYAEQLAAREANTPVVTYVPFRNGLFLACAASLAYSLGANVVCYGAHADDAAGSVYPDCSKDFAYAMRKAIKEGTGDQVDMYSPLITFTKTEVLERAIAFDTPLHLTWSCYEGGDKPCGKCGTCIDRAKAFAALGIDDPAM